MINEANTIHHERHVVCLLPRRQNFQKFLLQLGFLDFDTLAHFFFAQKATGIASISAAQQSSTVLRTFLQRTSLVAYSMVSPNKAKDRRALFKHLGQFGIHVFMLG